VWADCVVPENIHTPTTQVIGNSEGGGEFQRPNFLLKESISPNRNFQRGGGFKPEKPFMGGVWIFSGTTHSRNPNLGPDLRCAERMHTDFVEACEYSRLSVLLASGQEP